MAKERYRKISVRMWNDRDFNGLSNDAKLIWVYVLTCPAMLPFGAMKATQSGMAEELGMTPKGFGEGFRELLAKGMVKHCPKALCLVVPNFVQHNMPENPNVITSWRESIHMAPECDLLDEHMAYVAQQVKGLPEPFAKAFAKGFPIPFGKGMPKGMPNQEQEQEQEQEEETPLTPRGGEPAESPAIPKQTAAQRKDEAKAPMRAAILEAWNALAAEHGLPMVETMNPKRVRSLNARLDDAWFKAHWQEAMAMIPHSRFHLGVNERSWKATLDWFIADGKLQAFCEMEKAKASRPQPTAEPKPEPMSTSEYYDREIAKQKAADAAFRQQCIDEYLRDNPGAEIPEEAV